MRTTLEVCCGGIDDALAAARCGASRVELCSALELGGLTPSVGLVRQALERQPLPLAVMNRPRAGGFCYNAQEISVMQADAEALVAAGVEGVVFGALRRDGRIDAEHCRRLRDAIGDRAAVFHRAFDFVPDMAEALDQLIELGFTRILTSAGAPTALDGAERLRRLRELADGRIGIMPGGGVTCDNVNQLLTTTGCRQVHAGVSGPGFDASVDRNRALGLNDVRFLSGGGYRRVDETQLSQLVAAVARACDAALPG